MTVWSRSLSWRVFSCWWRRSLMSSARSKSFVTFWPVTLLVKIKGVHGTKSKVREILGASASRVKASFSLTMSHLLTTITMPLPASSIMPARRWSSCVLSSFTSINRKQTSLSSMAWSERRTLNFSMPTSCFPGLRIPAVSSSSIAWPLYLTATRLTSRVVPAMLATIACCLPASVLNRWLLPTFGRPINEIRSTSSGAASLRGGINDVMVLSVSSSPPVCSALVRIISLIPRRRNSSTGKLPLRSDLLVRRITGFLLLRAFFATMRSSSLGYWVESTTTRMTSAASAASVICS